MNKNSLNTDKFNLKKKKIKNHFNLFFSKLKYFFLKILLNKIFVIKIIFIFIMKERNF